MKTFDARQFCDDHRIPYWTEGFKQCGSGWIQLECPFCVGEEGPHLGYDESNGFFNCWRCGFHSLSDTVQRLLHINRAKAYQIIKQYQGYVHREARAITVKIRHSCKLPVGSGRLQKQHKMYLKNRKFDPDVLEKLWDLKGTGNLGPYKFRIIAPIFNMKNRMVSYQGRDTTGRSNTRYKACHASQEAEPHKTLLYGQWLAKQDWIVVVEGITDVWRLGPNSVATFGIKYKASQVSKLRHYQRRFILFDHADVQARRQAQKLASELSTLPGKVWNVDIPDNDPGTMSDIDAEALMKELEDMK